VNNRGGDVGDHCRPPSRVLQIVPHLPPPFEGVGTYAAVLADVLAERFGIETRFLVGDPAWSGGKGEGARPVSARTAASLLTGLSSENTVLLHYANYGYQSRGCPIWLVEGLTRWRLGAADRRLVTLFHEVSASGPPWRSSFWLQPLQRRLAATVARVSGAAVTSLELYGELIRPWTNGHEVMVTPVFSTVGEPAAALPFMERRLRIVVFGSAGIRRRAYGRFLPALAKAARLLAVEEILDVGPPVDLPVKAGDVPIRPLGILPAREVSDLLLGSIAGFLAYPPTFLPKSTIFAAYCAHGVLPVCAWKCRLRASTSPLAGQHYWSTENGGLGDPGMIASAAHDWYADHSTVRQAGAFRDLLLGERTLA